MTKTTTQHRVRDTAWMAVALLVLPVALARAVQLDDRGEMRLLMRAYTDVRIGTEKEGGSDDPLSFPRSAAGHVRQHRYFLELKFDHDIKRFATAGTGVARAFGWLDPDTLKYSLQYRGEGEGIYDYGPREWSDQFAVNRALRLDFPRFPNTGPALTSPTIPDGLIHQRIAFLRRVARQRHRFFLGYVDLGKGPVDIRIGRQILAWGETDNFRLLDNINPLDNGFGGFFIPLDERRVPLDMARGSYHFGSIGPIADAFLEGFAALGNRVSTLPGIPPGSPWEPGGLGGRTPRFAPSSTCRARTTSAAAAGSSSPRTTSRTRSRITIRISTRPASASSSRGRTRGSRCRFRSSSTRSSRRSASRACRSPGDH